MFLVPSSDILKINSFIFLALFGTFFLSIFAVISKRSPEVPHKKSATVTVVLRPASVFTFASAASSHISPSLRMSRVLALCSDTHSTRG